MKKSLISAAAALALGVCAWAADDSSRTDNDRVCGVLNRERTAQQIRNAITACQEVQLRLAGRRSFVRAGLGYGAGVGAFGATVAGVRAAVSTTQAWTAVGLVPIVLDNQANLSGAATLSVMTAHALQWVDARGQWYEEHFVEADTRSKALGSQIDGVMRAQGRAADALAVVQRSARRDDAQLQVLLGQLGVSENSNPAPSANRAAAGRQLLQHLGIATDSPARENLSAIAVKGAEAIAQSDAILANARLIQTALSARVFADGEAENVAAGWQRLRYNEIVAVNSAQSDMLVVSPEQSFRNVLAVPFTALSNFVRGTSNESYPQQRAAVTQRATPEFNAIGQAMGLTPTTVGVPAVNFDTLLTPRTNSGEETPAGELPALRDRMAELRVALERLRQLAVADAAFLNNGAAVDAITAPNFTMVRPTPPSAPAPAAAPGNSPTTVAAVVP